MKIKITLGIILVTALYFIISLSTEKITVTDVIVGEETKSIKQQQYDVVKATESIQENAAFSEITCTDINLIKDNYETELEYRDAVVKLSVDFANDLGVDKVVKEQLAQYAGWEVTEWRRVSRGELLPKTNLKAFNDSFELIGNSSKLRGKFEMAVSKGDIESIIAMLASGELLPNHQYLEDSVLSVLVKEVPSLDVDDIHALAQAGLSPSFYDLVTATNEGKSVALVQELFSGFGKDVNVAWEDNFHTNTLAMSAASSLSPELFDFWLSQGVSAVPLDNDLNALDMLPEPSNDQELVAAMHILSTLALDEEVYPYQFKSMNMIKSWLPDSAQEEYFSYFENYERAQSENPESYLANAYKASRNLNALGDKLKECDSDAHEVYVSLQKSRIQKLIPEHLKLPSTDTEVSNTFALERRLHSEPPHVVKSVEDMGYLRQLGDDGDWEELLRVSKLYEAEYGQEFIQGFTLHNLVRNNAPIQYIDEVLNYGSPLPEGILDSVVKSGNFEILKHLEKHGLDISRDGRRVLEYETISTEMKAYIEANLET